MLAEVRQRIGRVHVHLGELDRRHHPHRVDLRAERPKRREPLDALGLGAERVRVDDRERPAAHRLRNLVERRELQDPPDRGHLVGHGRIQFRHAWSTSADRSHGKNSAPA